MTRVLLADDHVAVRDGIRAVLADQRGSRPSAALRWTSSASTGIATVAFLMAFWAFAYNVVLERIGAESVQP